MQNLHSNTTKLTEFSLNFWLTKYPSISYHEPRKREIQSQFKEYFDSAPAYQTTLTAREYNTIVKVLETLERLEKIYKQTLEKQKKEPNLKIKRIFPEIKDSLTYITIGHLSKDQGVLQKGLDLENLHIRDYIQFCLYTGIRPNFEIQRWQ